MTRWRAFLRRGRCTRCARGCRWSKGVRPTTRWCSTRCHPSFRPICAPRASSTAPSCVLAGGAADCGPAARGAARRRARAHRGGAGRLPGRPQRARSGGQLCAHRALVGRLRRAPGDGRLTCWLIALAAPRTPPPPRRAPRRWRSSVNCPSSWPSPRLSVLRCLYAPDDPVPVLYFWVGGRASHAGLGEGLPAAVRRRLQGDPRLHGAKGRSRLCRARRSRRSSTTPWKNRRRALRYRPDDPALPRASRGCCGCAPTA